MFSLERDEDVGECTLLVVLLGKISCVVAVR